MDVEYLKVKTTPASQSLLETKLNEGWKIAGFTFIGKDMYGEEEFCLILTKE